MSTVVFDIETVGQPFEQFDEISRAAILKSARTPEEEQELKQGLGLSPLTGHVVVIALLDIETGSATVLFEPSAAGRGSFQEDAVDYVPCGEKEMLVEFWRRIAACRQFVTFNGRGFDCPFLIIRSGIHRIKPARDIMPYRFNTAAHIDLFDQLSFYGAVRRPGGLHMWTQAFGITSPKAGGVAGDQVQQLYEQGDIERIARYCMADVRATAELFRYWERYIKMDGSTDARRR